MNAPRAFNFTGWQPRKDRRTKTFTGRTKCAQRLRKPSWDTFVNDLIEDRDVTPTKHAAWLLSPCDLWHGVPEGEEGPAPYARRNAPMASWVALEWDHITPGERDQILVHAEGVRCFVYETASSTPDAPRLRMLADVDREFGRAEWSAVVTAQGHACGVEPAPESLRPSQGWYAPTAGCKFWRFDGDPIIVDDAVAAGGGADPVAASSGAVYVGDEARAEWDALSKDEQGRRFSAADRDDFPTAIEGKGGRNVMLNAVLHGFDHGIPFDVWTEHLVHTVWNSKCAPPWELDDLRRHAARVYESASGEFGANLLPPTHPTFGKDKIDDPRVEYIDVTDPMEMADLIAATVEGMTVFGIAPPGVGKTEGLKRLCEDRKDVTVTVPFKTLGESIAPRIGATFHENDREAARMVTTAASRSKYDRPAGAQDVGAIDELHSWFRQVAGECCRRNRAKTIRLGVDDLFGSRRGVALGADITDAQLRLLIEEGWRRYPGRKVRVTRCTAPALERAWEATDLNTPAVLFLRRLASDPSVPDIFTPDTKAEAEAMARHAQGLGFKIWLCTSENREDVTRLDDEELKGYDGLIYTSAAGDGLDIQARIGKVFATASYLPIDGPSRLQRCLRARNVDDPVIVIGVKNWKTYSRSTNPKLHAYRYRARGRSAKKRGEQAGVAGMRWDNDPFVTQLRALVDAENAMAQADPIGSIHHAAERYELPNVEPAERVTKEERDAVAGALRRAKTAVQEEKIDARVAAPACDEERYVELARKYRRTKSEEAEYQRALTERVIGPGLFDKNVAAWDFHGRFRAQVKKCVHVELVRKGDGPLVDWLDSYGARAISDGGVEGIEALIIARIEDTLGLSRKCETIRVSTRAQIEEWVADKPELFRIAGGPKPHAYPLRWVHGLLKNTGWTIAAIKHVGGGKRQYRYTPPDEKYLDHYEKELRRRIELEQTEQITAGWIEENSGGLFGAGAAVSIARLPLNSPQRKMAVRTHSLLAKSWALTQAEHGLVQDATMFSSIDRLPAAMAGAG